MESVLQIRYEGGFGNSLKNLVSEIAKKERESSNCPTHCDFRNSSHFILCHFKMNKLKIYSVVDFYNENNVAVVCTSWLDEDNKVSYWPSGPNSRDKLVKNHPPETNWPKFPCKWLMSYSKCGIYYQDSPSSS